MLFDDFELNEDEGFAILKPLEEDGTAILDSLVVYEDLQGLGHGSRILELILDYAYEEFELHTVYVHARPLVDDSRQADLVRFYESHGFEPTDEYIPRVGTYLKITFE